MPGGAEEAWKVIEQQQRNADAKVEQAKLELARGLSEQQRLIHNAVNGLGKWRLLSNHQDAAFE